jgi:ADP-dependent NAD(P)H-hydrate dehydratase
MTTPEPVTPNLLRAWPLPEPGAGKYGRGQVVVVGGAPRSPGAAMLASLSALRVGAGRLTIALGQSVAEHVAVAIPECGVVPLRETSDGHIDGSGLDPAASDLSGADAVLAGPGLDDADQAALLVSALAGVVGDDTVVALDAFALGVLGRDDVDVSALAGRLILTPNSGEAERLLGRSPAEPVDDVREIARRFGAVVSCGGVIAAPDGRVWASGTGTAGLGTSGSGDVLAGAIVGLCARGADPAQAAIWATYAHGAAGDRLAVRVGPLGYVASELVTELPRVLVEIGA